MECATATAECTRWMLCCVHAIIIVSLVELSYLYHRSTLSVMPLKSTNPPSTFDSSIVFLYNTPPPQPHIAAVAAFLSSVGGAKLPSILLFASCLSSFVISPWAFFISGLWGSRSGEWPTLIPTRTSVSKAPRLLSTRSWSHFITPGSKRRRMVEPPRGVRIDQCVRG